MRAWLLLGLLWAQLQDDFSDGDFTSNPTWSGTDAYWMITSDYRLRSNGPAATSTLYLSTPNSLLSETEWRFWVRVAFNPSAQNFARVYLVADRADLTDPGLNGYYLQLGGISGNLDSLELWRQQGSSHTRLAGGIRGRFGSTNNLLRVRVLRDAMGTWQVYTDSLGYWEEEFVVNDAVINTTSYFGVYFQHTSTNRQNLWFDDFYIGPVIVDTAPPQLLSAEAVSSTVVRLTFSEALDPISAQNPAHYSLTPGGLTIASAQRISPAVVELILNGALQPSVVYTLTFTDLRDLSGNTSSGSTSVVLPEAPMPGDIILSEIMAKPTPAVSLPPYEYVELYNRSQKWLQVGGMRLCDVSTCGMLPARLLAPGAYLLLIPASASMAFSAHNPLVLSAWPILNDSGDSLTLLSTADEVMEIIKYRSTWYRDPMKAQGGWSLERIDLDDFCSADSNWIASNDPRGGTPGAANSVLGLWRDETPPTVLAWQVLSETEIEITFSEPLDTVAMQDMERYTISGGVNVVSASVESQRIVLRLSGALQTGTTYTLTIQAQDCKGNDTTAVVRFGMPEVAVAGDIVFTEVMAKPTPAVELPPYEYVELYNRSQKWIAIGGWLFCDGSGCATLPEKVIGPGEYLVLTSNSGARALSGAIGLSGFPILNDSGDNLLLLRADSVVIEQVQYRSTWYRDPIKAQGGWSLERIDLDDLCSADSNWIASNDPRGGTPGTANSVLGLWRDETPPTVLTWQVLSETEIEITFSEPLDTAAMQDMGRYAVSGGVNIVGASVEMQRVVLRLSGVLQAATTYTLTIHAQDCKGNDTTAVVRFGMPEVAVAGDIVFTEVMAKPTPPVDLPPYEYVELYNRSQKWIAIGGWLFCDGSGCATLPEKVIGPREYLVLTSNSGARALSGAIGLSGFPILNDSGDNLLLLRADSVVIEQVQYRSTWYRDPIKARGGWSLERIDLDDLCSADSNWIASNDPRGGTPGTANSVLGLWKDRTPPSLVNLAFHSPEKLILHFSEALDTVLMKTLSRYRIVSGPPIATVRTWTREEFEVRLAAPLQPSVEYILEVEAIDCNGNNAFIQYPFGLPSPAAPFDVVITEIMADPDPPVGLPPYEYVELHNRSDKYIQLEGWKIEVGRNQRILPSYLMRPGDYVVLSSQNGGLALAPYGPVISLPSFPSLSNRGATVILRDTSGRVIESVSYTDRWYRDAAKKEGGWSLERIWAHWLCAGESGWKASESPMGGTPGAPNSVASPQLPPVPNVVSIRYIPPAVQVYFSERMDTLALMEVDHYEWEPPIPLIAATPLEGGFGVELLPMAPLEENRTYVIIFRGLLNCASQPVDTLRAAFVVPAPPEPYDIVINEILPEPQTGGDRYVELYNRSKKIIDLGQLMLARGGQPYSFREITGEEPVLLFPHSYICLTADTQDVQSRYLPPSHARFHQIKSLPAYNYQRDTVWLIRRADSVPIDWVPYASAYHFPDLRSRKGVALERLSPEKASTDPQNWYSAASTVRYGTPGYANSQREGSREGTSIHIEPKTFSPDGDGYDDMLWIYIPAEVPDTRADVRVYTLGGYLVRTIVEGALLAVGENTFRWEGVDTEGRRLPAGVYIVHITLTEPTRGKVQQYRLPCAIAERIR